jgi:hypothetical protein
MLRRRCEKVKYKTAAQALDKLRFYKRKGRTTRLKHIHFCMECVVYHLTSKRQKIKE